MKKLMTVLFTMGFLIGVSVTFADTIQECLDKSGDTCLFGKQTGTFSCTYGSYCQCLCGLD